MTSKRARQKQRTKPAAVRLNLWNVEDLRWEMQSVQLAIARRAYELFEKRGGEHGHDWEDWFRAESELLRPVSVSMSESDDRISVRANVLGFEGNELKVSVEP
jgi:HSP20 family protein